MRQGYRPFKVKTGRDFTRFEDFDLGTYTPETSPEGFDSRGFQSGRRGAAPGRVRAPGLAMDAPAVQASK